MYSKSFFTSTLYGFVLIRTFKILFTRTNVLALSTRIEAYVVEMLQDIRSITKIPPTGPVVTLRLLALSRFFLFAQTYSHPLYEVNKIKA